MDDLKVSEVAKQFRVSRQAIHAWLKKGTFPNAYKIGVHIRIPATDVENAKQNLLERQVANG